MRATLFMVLSHRANDHICHSQLHIKNFVLLLREGDQKYFTKKAGLKSVIHFIEVLKPLWLVPPGWI